MRTQLTRCLIVMLICAPMLIFGAGVAAQSNPSAAACGLPAQGTIVASVAYTLSADCAQTGLITINSGITLTINGNDNSITFPVDINFVSGGANTSLVLNRVTIDGGRVNHTQPIQVENLTASQVSFINASNGPMLTIATSASLTNVLLAGNTSFEALSTSSQAGTAILATGSSTATLHNVAIRNNLAGNAAVFMRSGASLTATGCLTLSGNAPYDTYGDGTFTDNSTGACSGTIGNGHQGNRPAQPTSCGFPASGNMDVSTTYTLSANCELSGNPIYISEDTTIRIVGNGQKISASRSGYSIFTAATSTLQLENVALESIRIMHWGRLTADRLKASKATNGFFVNFGEARFSKALFADNSTTLANSRSVMLIFNGYENGFTSFTDSAFRNNTGGFGALQIIGATVELNGCVIFESNTPADWSGTVIDNRDDTCGTTIIDPIIIINPPGDNGQGGKSMPAAPSGMKNCDLRLGAIGLICRPRVQPPVAEVWRISPESEGLFMLAVSQPQVEAVDEGLVACSPDGRVAARTGLSAELRSLFERSPKYRAELLVPRRYIVIAKGPTFEGKVHHVVLDNALDGRVFGTVDTIGGPPAPECIVPAAGTEADAAAPSVIAQPPRPDGSIAHIVQAGDTVSAIAVAYRVHQLEIIMANRLEDMGRWIYPGQELLIRDAAG